MPEARIRFTGPRLDKPLDVALSRVEQRLREDQMLELNARGLVNGTPLDLQAIVGPLANLVATRGVVVQVGASLGRLGLRWADTLIRWQRPPTPT